MTKLVDENLDAWLATFNEDFVAHYRATGAFDWKKYNRARVKSTVPGPGIDLSQSRLMLISSAGGYLKEVHTPFDAEAPFGDYSIRTFPTSTRFEALEFAHGHYDHEAVNTDPQVLLPLRHLEDLVRERVIGELAPDVISFSGYQPDISRIINDTIPAILQLAQSENIDAAFLVPA